MRSAGRRAGRGCAAPGAASGSRTFAPSLNRSAPCVTTTSPAATPDATAARSPSTTPSVTGRTDTVRSALTTNTKVLIVPLGAPRRTAAVGTTS